LLVGREVAQRVDLGGKQRLELRIDVDRPVEIGRAVHWSRFAFA
jgi:hypothetical protein